MVLWQMIPCHQRASWLQMALKDDLVEEEFLVVKENRNIVMVIMSFGSIDAIVFTGRFLSVEAAESSPTPRCLTTPHREDSLSGLGFLLERSFQLQRPGSNHSLPPEPEA